MANAYVGAAGSGTDNVNNTATVPFTTTRQVNVGEMLLLAVYDVFVSHGALVSVDDGQGNTYTIDRNDHVGDYNCAIARSRVTTQIPNSTTVTATFAASSTNVRVIIADVESGAATSPLDKANGQGSFTESAQPGTTGALVEIGEFAYNIVLAEGSKTFTADTGAGYTKTTQVQFGGLTMAPQYAIIADTTAQNPAMTWTGQGNATWVSEIATYKADVAVELVPYQPRIQQATATDAWPKPSEYVGRG